MHTESVQMGAKSHEAHEKHLDRLIKSEKDLRLIPLKSKDHVEYMVNVRTLDILEPFLKTSHTWLTIGDYNGFEAKYLTERNQKAVASDISDSFLKAAKEEGLILEYSKENVEHLSFEDGRFDYTMCREAYHHFPRAYLGAYEMIRVANKATIIIEPIDVLQKMPFILWLKNVLDLFNPSLINKVWKNRFSFETVGNYVFKISEREVEKMAMGIGLPCIAFKNINIALDQLGPGTKDIPYNKTLWKKFQRLIAVKNFFSALHITPYNTLCSVIFKQMPDQKMLNDLKESGYKVLMLPKNPYIK